MNISFGGKIYLRADQYKLKDANGNEKKAYTSNEHVSNPRLAEDIVVNTDHIAYRRYTTGEGNVELMMSNGDTIIITKGYNGEAMELACLLQEDETISYTPFGEYKIKKSNVQKLLDSFHLKKEDS